jgi:hypothetical protein
MSFLFLFELAHSTLKMEGDHIIFNIFICQLFSTDHIDIVSDTKNYSDNPLALIVMSSYIFSLLSWSFMLTDLFVPKPHVVKQVQLVCSRSNTSNTFGKVVVVHKVSKKVQTAYWVFIVQFIQIFSAHGTWSLL